MEKKSDSVIKNTKLQRIFSLLSQEEKTLVRWSYTHKTPPLSTLAQRLFEALCIHPTASKEGLWQILLPNKVYNDTHLRKIMHDLTAYIEDRMVSQQVLQDTNSQSYYLAQWLLQKQAKEEALQVLSQHKSSSALQHLQVEELKYQLYAKDREQSHSIQRYQEQLVLWYTQEQLKLQLAYQTQQTIIASNTTVAHHNLVVEQAKALEHYPIIKAYILALELIKNYDDVLFQELKLLFFNHYTSWSTDECKVIITLLLNTCIRKINLKALHYQQEALELYALGLRQDFFSEYGILSHFTYKNMMTLSLQVQDFDFAQGLLDNYTKYLTPEKQDSYFNFCSALFYIEQHLFKKALKHLASTEYEDQLLSLNAKALLLKTYHELGNYEALEYLLDSFVSYIKRKKVQGFYKNYFLLLVKYTKRLVLAYQPQHYEKLLITVQQAPNFSNKDWLLQKLNQYL